MELCGDLGIDPENVGHSSFPAQWVSVRSYLRCAL